MSKLTVVLLVFGLVGCQDLSATAQHPPVCASNGVLYTWHFRYNMYTSENEYCIPTENVK